MKIIDKVNEKIAANQPFFSFEYFPPRTDDGVENLFERMERMVTNAPVFCDITWGAGGSTAEVTLGIAERMQTQICVETMMHLTCTNMQEEMLHSALDKVRAYGLQNILALRGDPPKGQEKFEAVEGGLSCALDLVKFIRKEHGDYFGICVAGYPEAHPDTVIEGDDVHNEKAYWENMAYLKQKVEAGGDMIITQLFYDCDKFVKFCADCKAMDINVPILPGIMPIMTYGGFKRMTGFCKTFVPQEILDVVESNKDNEEGLKNYGIELGAEMCRKLLAAGAPGVHLYSLNLERSAVGILERLGMVYANAPKIPRSLPWKSIPQGTSRQVEGVRPVFWANRSKSYLARTYQWGTFPTTRWGESELRQFGSIAANPYMKIHTSTESRKGTATAAWGSELKSVDDVKEVFTKYYKGDIALLPWSEGSVASGSDRLKLATMAEKGFLPINFQPSLNGLPSSDPEHGWGASGGYVYQKAYIEFFVSPEGFEALLPTLKESSTMTYMAASASGEVVSNMDASKVDAVSWGVFPGSEIVQPSVFDVNSFAAWKEEAFELWSSDWSNLYEEGSTSQWLLNSIKNSWVLVSVVDNDYVAGDLIGSLVKA
eukprot:gene19960-26668_t